MPIVGGGREILFIACAMITIPELDLSSYRIASLASIDANLYKRTARRPTR